MYKNCIKLSKKGNIQSLKFFTFNSNIKYIYEILKQCLIHSMSWFLNIFCFTLRKAWNWGPGLPSRRKQLMTSAASFCQPIMKYIKVNLKGSMFFYWLLSQRRWRHLQFTPAWEPGTSIRRCTQRKAENIQKSWHWMY